jgi:hypothetical protein
MAAPLAIAAISATVIGSGISAYSAISQGDYQAQVAKNNAQIASNNSTYALQQGAVQEQDQALKTRAAVGEETASAASNGIDVNTGSAATVRAGTVGLGALSGATIRNNAARAALGFTQQSEQFSDQAQADAQAGALGAAAAGIGGVSQAGGLYNSFLLSGALPGANSPTFVGN